MASVPLPIGVSSPGSDERTMAAPPQADKHNRTDNADARYTLDGWNMFGLNDSISGKAAPTRGGRKLLFLVKNIYLHKNIIKSTQCLEATLQRHSGTGRAARTVPTRKVSTRKVPTRTVTALLAPPSLALPMLALLYSAAGMAGAGTLASPVSRPATAAELRSFDQFLRQYDPAPGAGKAQLTVERPNGKGPWQLSATMETPPRLAMPGVCRLERSVFRHVPRAPDGQPWRSDGMAQAYVWLAVDGPCVAPARPVRLLQALPPQLVLQLLKENAALLNRARLLFAGNTQCARLRALPFALDALGAGARAAGAPTIYTLLFRGERGEHAQVDARYSRAELTAWNVSCPAP